MKSVFFAAACVIAGIVASATAADRKVIEEGLIVYTITDEAEINQSLTGKAGDAVKGRSLAINRKKAIVWHVTSCQSMSSLFMARQHHLYMVWQTA